MVAKNEIDWSFWAKVNIGKPNECWEWKKKLRYPRYGVHKQQYSHRYAFQEIHGKIKTDLWMLHKCGNHKCVNPKHLYLGTPIQNANDRERHMMNRFRPRILLEEKEIGPNKKLTRNHNYRCNDNHIYKIIQLADLIGVSKSMIARQSIDIGYVIPEIISGKDNGPTDMERAHNYRCDNYHLENQEVRHKMRRY